MAAFSALPRLPRWRREAKHPSATAQESFAAILRIDTERAFAADKTAGAKARRDGFAFYDRPRRGAPALRCARFAWRGEESTFESLTRLRRALTPLFESAAEAPSRAATVAIDCRVAAATPRALFAALVGGARLPDCKSEKTPPPSEIALFGGDDDEATRRALADAEIDARANSLTRALARTPPNFLSPRVFVEIATKLAAAHSSIETQILDRRALQKTGAGALLAVARGGGDCFVMRLSYRPPRAGKTSQRPLALVGKGITFDTGGYNLKPARHMRGMKTDMHGAAVALAAVLAAAESESPVAVDGWLALAENLISPAAYRPDEVARALTGKTIEIVHTDAEGRLALADAIALAARRRPRALVTYATLTGSMIAALGARMSGVFASDDEWLARALAASVAGGERLCAFPAPTDYRQDIDSEIADIAQCAADGEADHIHAAIFLREFFPASIPWLHLDISASTCKGGLAAAPGEETGFGAVWSATLLRHLAAAAR